MADNKRVLYLIQQAGMLMLMPRTHKRNLGNTFDTVASHSFHTAIIAYCIARMEKLNNESALKSMCMGLIHDMLEARTVDMDFAAKNYVTINEEQAIKDTYVGIDFGGDLEDTTKEYEKRETKESQCAKDADLIEQMFQEWVLMWQGNKLAEEWFTGKLKLTVPKLYTKSAKRLVMQMKDSTPQEWWWTEFVKDSYNSKNLTGRK